MYFIEASVREHYVSLDVLHCWTRFYDYMGEIHGPRMIGAVLFSIHSISYTSTRLRAFYQPWNLIHQGFDLHAHSVAASCLFRSRPITWNLLTITFVIGYSPYKMATNRAPFPSNPDDFDSDTRISYSKTTKNYTLEDENGEEWEWFPRTSKWVPMVRTSR